MRALFVILGAMALLIGVATQPASAGKGTDIEQFMKQLGYGSSLSMTSSLKSRRASASARTGARAHTGRSVGLLWTARRPLCDG